MMDSINVDAIHDGQRIPTLRAIGKQATEMTGTMLTVTCPCGASRNVRSAYQCLYCEVWFCSDCAEDHFGPRDGGDQ